MEHKTNQKNRKRVEQAQSGAARAALLGASDGLVTNISLILGVAGAGASGSVVRLAGVASLIAGACSMAVGEYISMRGQVEMLSGVLDAEQEELSRDPKAAHAALEAILIKDGVSKDTAHKASLEIAKDTGKAMTMYARGTLGINPEELGSARASAISSFVMFSLGALVPLLAWFFTSGGTAIIISIALSVISALGIGAYLGYVTSGKLLRASVRQLLVLLLAAGATFIIGHLLHTTIT
jgi:VIT1/CCC1 family predicted Fe2+/Mn2+ transporter